MLVEEKVLGGIKKFKKSRNYTVMQLSWFIVDI